jgi:hypothetical protein
LTYTHTHKHTHKTRRNTHSYMHSKHPSTFWDTYESLSATACSSCTKLVRHSPSISSSRSPSLKNSEDREPAAMDFTINTYRKEREKKKVIAKSNRKRESERKRNEAHTHTTTRDRYTHTHTQQQQQQQQQDQERESRWGKRLEKERVGVHACSPVRGGLCTCVCVCVRVYSALE